MLQPDADLPVVPECPPPWHLTGSAWIVALRLAPGSAARTAFLDGPAAAQLRSPLALLMYVDYTGSPCGPYRELLFIPGHVPFEDGRRHFTISRILVSTWESVVNGRRNWGIPKDRAQFEVGEGDRPGGGTTVRVTADDGHELCAMHVVPRKFAPRLPVPGALLPAGMRTLAQRYAGSTCYYAPAASGWIRPARLVDWRFDPAFVPDLCAASILATGRVDSFRMTFPRARTAPRV
ncbi:MAG TPA: hypothetical protein VF277_04665 [Steroidobacteraceae bacterium]